MIIRDQQKRFLIERTRNNEKKRIVEIQDLQRKLNSLAAVKRESMESGDLEISKNVETLKLAEERRKQKIFERVQISRSARIHREIRVAFQRDKISHIYPPLEYKFPGYDFRHPQLRF